MSNNLTNTTIKSVFLSGIVLGFLASCADGSSGSGRSVKASFNERNKATCVPIDKKPCPVAVETADAPDLSESSLGFFESTDTSIPSGARKIRESVVKIIVPQNNLQSVKEIQKWILKSTSEDNVDLENLITKTQEEIDRAQSAVQKDQLLGVLVQLKQCKLKNQTECKILKTSAVQTAIVMGSKKTLVTTLDVVVDYAKTVQTDLPSTELPGLILFFNKLDLPIAVITQDNQILTGADMKINVASETENEALKIKSMTKIAAYLKGAKNFKAADNILTLQTASEIPVADVLGRSESPVKVKSSDDIFTIGYAAETKNRERNNANGQDAFITKGKLASISSIKKVLNPSGEITKEDEAKLMGLSNDSNEGMKGGPIVNEAGEFLGIVAFVQAEAKSSTTASTSAEKKLQKQATLGVKNSIEGF